MGTKQFSVSVSAAIFLCLCTGVMAAPVHTISGYVRTAAGTGVKGVNVAADNAAGSSVTGADGAYSVTVPNKWDGTITVSKAGWLITPGSRTYSNISDDIANENYAAYQPKISGTVTKQDGTPLAGVTVTGDNGGGTTTTNVAGTYELSVPYNWSGTLSASLSGYGFTAKTHANLISDQINQDFSGFQPKIGGYVISMGTVTFLSGVVLTADNGGGTAVSQSNGYYQLIVPYNWSGTVSASLTGWGFKNKTYTNVIADLTFEIFEGFQPIIHGYIKKADGTAITGAIVTANNGGGNYTTGPTGYYSIRVPYDWSGTIVPSLDGYLFAAKNYSNVVVHLNDQNFSGFQPTISGSTNITGVTVTAGGANSVVSTPAYSLTVPYGWTGNIEATFTGYQFTESPRVYTNVTENWQNQNFTPYQPKLSGYVRKADGSSVEGVVIDANNGGGNSSTDVNGYYEIIVPYNWSGQLIASKLKWQITPETRFYTNVATDLEEQNFTGVYTSTIIVKADGTGHAPTIQVAIDLAVDGDIVQVENGTYMGNGNWDVDFRGKAITVCGNVADPNLVIIDCRGGSEALHRAFSFTHGESRNSVLKNVTITNGHGPYIWLGYLYSVGGAIYCHNSNPTIENCLIRNNRASSGGGIYNDSGSPVIRNCIISSNEAADNGGGIYSDRGNATIAECKILDNTGGGAYNYRSQTVIEQCLVAGNGGGGLLNTRFSGVNIANCVIINNLGVGIYNSASYSAVTNCTITRNFTRGVSNSDGCNTIIQNCIIWDNVLSQLYGSGHSVSYSNIQGGFAGTENINLDPLFAADGYHLTESSPCFNAGDPGYVAEPNETDIDGNPRVYCGRVDMGADEFMDAVYCSLSGHVKKAVDNSPVGGVNVSVGDLGSTMTNADGYFSFDVPVGWSGTMILSKTGIEEKVVNFTNVTSDSNATYLVNLAYTGGEGSADNPYQIANAEQLYWLSMQPAHWDKSFVLVDDIDMNDPNAAGFRSIGNRYQDVPILIPFSGNFDGGGHVIRNLELAWSPQMDQTGLFGYIQVPATRTSVIRNVRITDAFITGHGFWGTGTLAGRVHGLGSFNVLIENCRSEGGMVLGEKFAGGLLGYAEGNVTVCGCFAGTPVQTNNSGGGLIGCIAGSRVQESSVVCDVNSLLFDVGGFAGSIYSSEVNNCHVEGAVRGNNVAGGFAARSEGGLINDCYAACAVSGIKNVGGFVGYSPEAAATVFNACFWDIDISGTSDGVGNINPDSAGVTAKTTAQMKMLLTFTGWDFADTWAICEETNYPRLQWQIPVGDFVCPDGVAVEDLEYYAGWWLMDGCASANNYCGGADLDYSGTVDLDDFAALAAQWLWAD